MFARSRGRRTTLAGTADDSTWQTTGRDLVDDSGGDSKKSTADDSGADDRGLGGGLWDLADDPGGDLVEDSGRDSGGDGSRLWRGLGGRLWRGRRNDPGGDGGRLCWRTTLAGSAGDPGGDGGRPWRGRQTTLAGTWWTTPKRP